MELDWDTLYSEAGTGVFESGKKRFYDNRVFGINSGFEGGKFFITANLSGEKEYTTKILFDEQGGLYDYNCDCEVFQVADGPCKHIVATALTYEDKFPSTIIAARPVATAKSRSDAGARNLITEYSKRKHSRAMGSEEEKVKLVPIMTLDAYDRLSLKFTIGRNKKYTLKDISDFASCVLTGAERRYGVELEVTHRLENFDEKSQPLVQFVVGSYREKAEFAKDVPAFNQSYRDELKLLGGDADNFFDLYSGQVIQWDDGTIRDGLRLIVPAINSLNALLEVVPAEGGFNLTLDLPKFRLATGKKYRYIITDSRIFRLTEEYFTCVFQFFKAFEAFGKMFVAEADMPMFYNSVIVQIMEFIEVKSEFDLSVFEAAPFVAKLYLEPDGEGNFVAHLKCTYDDKLVNILDDSLITDMVRDWESENVFKTLLIKYFSQYPHLVVSGEDAIYRFMSTGLGELFNYAELYIADEIKRMKVKKPPRIRVGVRLESDLLDVDLSADGFTTQELIEVLHAYREKRDYIRLADGSFVDLIDPSIGALSEILEVAQTEAGQVKMPAYYAPFLDNELKSGFFSLERSSDFKKLVKTLSGADDSEIAVPQSLKTIMRNYQKTGFRWLKTLADYKFGGVLADDMGLGKSLQVIALLKDSGNTSIIVCPTTLILNWVNEFTKFAPDLKILPITGSYGERKLLSGKALEYDVVITSYELMRRDDNFYEDIVFEYAILDEAQYIKNPETKNARAAKTLRAKHRFALTGTPIENSLAELWSLFDFVMPGYLYSYPRFKERFESEVVRGDKDATERLQKLVRPFILRRLKSGVLKELPPKIESNVMASLAGEQRALYLANLSLIKDSVNSAGKEVNKVVVLSMLTKLRQICCEPRLVYPDYAGNSEKLDTCMELVQTATESGHKVLLFSQFTSMLDIVREKLVESGITYYILKGDTPKTERMKLVNKFNNDETQVFLISLKAGGTGLNLTGADVVIHYDPWWNESVMNQATDRAYRLGQDKSVQVYKLILEDSIEQKILKLQERKSVLSGLITGNHGNLSYDDIISILD